MIDWDRVPHTSHDAQFLMELDVALLMGEDDRVRAILEWREAWVIVSEFWQHCDKHMIAYYDGDMCRACKAEAET